jgi:hypothetical protein
MDEKDLSSNDIKICLEKNEYETLCGRIVVTATQILYDRLYYHWKVDYYGEL